MKSFKKFSLILAVIFILTALFSNFVLADGINEKSNSEKITILSTADVHGRIYAYEYATDSVDENAGYAKLQTLIKQEKAKAPNALLIDCGDVVQDNSAELFNDLPVHPMVQAMNRMGFDTWTLGNHEFNFEKAFLDRNIAAFKNTVLAANIYKADGTRYVKPYKILVVNGVRIAVVGLLPPYIPQWEASAPEHFQGLVFTDPLKEAKKVIKELKGKYDILVGAFHLGPNGEYGGPGAIDIANACPEFSVIFCGHAHSRFSDKVANGVKLIEPGAYGWALAKAEINVEKTQVGYKVTHVSVANLQTREVKEENEILKEFEFVHKKSVNDANKVVGQLKGMNMVPCDQIKGIPTVQIEETPLTDFINEVMLYYSKADVVAHQVEDYAKIDMGPIKKKDIALTYQYATGEVTVYKITGKDLKDYMEWSAGYFNQSKPGDVTVSFDKKRRASKYSTNDIFGGVTYEIDLSKPYGKRIVNLKYPNGTPVKLGDSIKLGINAYRMDSLIGKGEPLEGRNIVKLYSTKDGSAFGDVEGRIRNLMIRYIKEVKKGVIVGKLNNTWRISGVDLNLPGRKAVEDLVNRGIIEIPKTTDGRYTNVAAINVYEPVTTKLIQSLVKKTGLDLSRLANSKNTGELYVALDRLIKAQ